MKKQNYLFITIIAVLSVFYLISFAQNIYLVKTASNLKYVRQSAAGSTIIEPEYAKKIAKTTILSSVILFVGLSMIILAIVNKYYTNKLKKQNLILITKVMVYVFSASLLIISIVLVITAGKYNLELQSYQPYYDPAYDYYVTNDYIYMQEYQSNLIIPIVSLIGIGVCLLLDKDEKNKENELNDIE